MLKRKRKELGLTQTQMADKLGISLTTIKYWETSRSYPNFKYIVRVAKAYKMSDEEIIEWLNM